MSSNIYAQVFVSASLEKEAFIDLICQFSNTATKAKFTKINTNEISIDVRKNEDYDPQKDSFINYRYYLDVNPFVGIDKDAFLRALAKLMAFLKKQGYPAVASCDWEDELAVLVEGELK